MKKDSPNILKIPYKLKKLYNGVYLCTVPNAYDLAMIFCRAQEFYESAFAEIKGHSFTMTHFQKIYSEKYGKGSFTYPKDWKGFNVPDWSIREMYRKGIIDGNEYDRVFNEIVGSILEKKFYLIGAQKKDKATEDHEICHAFFYLKAGYKQIVTDLISKMSESLYNRLSSHLNEMGYTETVVVDEIQAYAATNVELFLDNIKLTKLQRAELIDIGAQIHSQLKLAKKDLI